MHKEYQQLFLRVHLNAVRSKLKNCTYLAFEKEKDTYFFCANLKNAEGGKDKVKVKINKGLDSVQAEDFEELYNMLNNRNYDSGTNV